MYIFASDHSDCASGTLMAEMSSDSCRKSPVPVPMHIADDRQSYSACIDINLLLNTATMLAILRLQMHSTCS